IYRWRVHPSSARRGISNAFLSSRKRPLYRAFGVSNGFFSSLPSLALTVEIWTNRRCAREGEGSSRDRFPVLRQMLAGAPGKRLNCERWIVCATGSHNGSAENSKIRRFVRKTPAVDDVRFRIVSHARTAVCVCRHRHGTDVRSLDGNGTGGAVPLLHLVLHK